MNGFWSIFNVWMNNENLSPRATWAVELAWQSRKGTESGLRARCKVVRAGEGQMVAERLWSVIAQRLNLPCAAHLIIVHLIIVHLIFVHLIFAHLIVVHLIIVHLTIVPVISTSTRRFCKLQVGIFCVSGNNLPSAAPHHLSHPILAAFHTDRNQCIGQISTTPEARMPDFEA